MKATRQFERWAPVLLALALGILWQVIVMAFAIPEFIFPSPWEIGKQFAEFKGPLMLAAWATFWVTMVGFALSIVTGVMLGFLIGSSRLAYAAVRCAVRVASAAYSRCKRVGHQQAETSAVRLRRAGSLARERAGIRVDETGPPRQPALSPRGLGVRSGTANLRRQPRRG